MKYIKSMYYTSGKNLSKRSAHICMTLGLVLAPGLLCMKLYEKGISHLYTQYMELNARTSVVIPHLQLLIT